MNRFNLFADWKRRYLILVLFISFAITITLAAASRYINFWPSDSYYFYVPTAANLFSLPHFSAMHYIPAADSLGRISMHGKESLIFFLAIFQKILHDEQSLFPNVLLLLLALQVSAVAIYFIFKEIFDEHVAFIAFLLFSSCLWPYLYALQGAHQPLALMFFLLTVLLGQYTGRFKSFYFLGGLCFGFMLFSSPTALIYLPYFLMARLSRSAETNENHRLRHYGIFIIGCGLIIFLFTFPDPVANLQKFVLFFKTSQSLNHFHNYAQQLSALLPGPYSFSLPAFFTFRGAGWSWIFKYCFLVIPFLFVFYIASLIYLIARVFLERKRRLMIILLLSLSSPFIIETAQVCQFGRNYFSWLFGMIFVIGLALFELKKQWRRIAVVLRRAGLVLIFLIIAGHIIFNVYTFITDIFPARLFTTRIHFWLKAHGIQDLWVYQEHPNTSFTARFVNNPKILDKIRFWTMENILSADGRYALVPPLTGRTIWNDCMAPDFTADPLLTKLYQNGSIEKYAVASFPSLASSRIWAQEEEICSYRDLILGQIPQRLKPQTFVYILDLSRIRADYDPLRQNLKNQ